MPVTGVQNDSDSQKPLEGASAAAVAICQDAKMQTTSPTKSRPNTVTRETIRDALGLVGCSRADYGYIVDYRFVTANDTTASLCVAEPAGGQVVSAGYCLLWRLTRRDWPAVEGNLSGKAVVRLDLMA